MSFASLDPVVIPIAAACAFTGMSLLGALALYDRRRRARRTRLPRGAEAALWSVTEVMPDPRNHLAIKDPTSEMRLTDSDRAQARRAAGGDPISLVATARRARAREESARREARAGMASSGAA